MNIKLGKSPREGSAATGIELTTGLAPCSMPTDMSTAAPATGPGGPITSVDSIGVKPTIPLNSIDPPAAGGPGGQQ